MAYLKGVEPLICYTFYKCLGHVPGSNINNMIPSNIYLGLYGRPTLHVTCYMSGHLVC